RDRVPRARRRHRAPLGLLRCRHRELARDGIEHAHDAAEERLRGVARLDPLIAQVRRARSSDAGLPSRTGRREGRTPESRRSSPRTEANAARAGAPAPARATTGASLAREVAPLALEELVVGPAEVDDG